MTCQAVLQIFFLSDPLVLEDTSQVTAIPHTSAIGSLQMVYHHIKNLWLRGHASWYWSTDLCLDFSLSVLKWHLLIAFKCNSTRKFFLTCHSIVLSTITTIYVQTQQNSIYYSELHVLTHLRLTIVFRLVDGVCLTGTDNFNMSYCCET
jgi:hypothetical protein